MKLLLLTALLLAVAREASRADEPDVLAARLRPLIDAHRGQVAVAVKRLNFL